MDALSISNTSQIILKEFCEVQQTFNNFNEFFECYKYFAKKELARSIFALIMVSSSIILNLIVLISLIFGSRNKICFDKILVGYCLVDALTSNSLILEFIIS